MRYDLLFLGLLFSFQAGAQQNINIQQKTYLYQTPSFSARKIATCEFMHGAEFISKEGKVQNGQITDFWYKISYDNKTGYVFGDHTSWRLRGQRVVKMKFKGCDIYDSYRYFFDDYDFAEAPNVPDLYKELCVETDQGIEGKKQYINKTFTLLVNNLWGYDADERDDAHNLVITKRMTIISILNIEK